MKKLLKMRNSKSKKDTNSSISFLKFSLVFFLIISLLIHLIVFLSAKHFLISSLRKSQNQNLTFELMNNNKDNLQSPKKNTHLASEQESRAQGHLTKKKGDNWVAPQKEPNDAIQHKKNNAPKKQHIKSIIMTFYKKTKQILKKENKLETSMTSIPSHYDFHKTQALNFDSFGNISFDTTKYKNAPYFKRMVKKIAKYWYSAIPSYAHYMGLIPTGDIKIVFLIDRQGHLIDYKVIQDFNYKSMTQASIFAITHASPFEPLPESIKGTTLLIPFHFQYINPRKK